MPRLDQIERVLRIATYLKFLFGSPKSSMIVLLVIGAVLLIGFFTIRIAFDSGPALREADKTYAQDKIDGVAMYKDLLAKRDFLDPSQFWLTDDRDRLYRRIISFEVRYGARDEARDYINKAWKENFKELSFEDEESRQLWNEVTTGVAAPPMNGGSPSS